MAKTKTLIDVTQSIAQGEIVELERPETVADAMLRTKKYRGSGFGRYIDAEEKDEFFAKDGTLQGIANDEPKAEEPAPEPEPEAEPEKKETKTKSRRKSSTKKSEK